MANIFDDGSGNRSATTTLAGGSSSKDGYQFTGLNNVGERSIFFNYDFGGNAGSFKVKFRYHNGISWGAWHYLYFINTSDERVNSFVNTDADTGVCEFLLSSQDFYKANGMRGFQIQIERLTGSDDIDFSNGVEI